MAMGIQLQSRDGVAEVVIDFPPVNALPAQGWFDLADAVAAAGADPAVRAVCSPPRAAASARAWTSRRCSGRRGTRR